MNKKTLLWSILPFSYLVLLLFQIDLGMIEDLGRHLKMGEIILSCHCVPSTNLFSYVASNFPIVNHEWLTQVILYVTYHTFGFPGLLVLKMLTFLTAFTIIYTIALKKSSLFWVILFSFLCIAVLSTRFRVRPEMFSYLFLAVFLWLTEHYKTTKQMVFLSVLPVLMVLWVNMHIYFIFGVAWYALFCVELWWEQQKKLPLPIILIGISLLLATLVNPSTVRGALLPFTIFHNYDLSVEENKSPFTVLNSSYTFTYTLLLQILIFESLAFGAVIILFWKRLKNLSYRLQSFSGALLGVKMVRCISLIGIMGLVPLSEAATHLEKRLQKRFDAAFMKSSKVFLSIALIVLISIHLKGLGDYDILHFSFQTYAEKGTDFYIHNHIQGPLFNNYMIGNYLIFRLYPQQKVYVDARPEAYPPGFFTDYWRMLSDEKFFNQQVNKYQINAVVFGVQDDATKIRPFLLRLLASPDWVPVYGDGNISILVRNTPQNKTVIEKYRIKLQ